MSIDWVPSEERTRQQVWDAAKRAGFECKPTNKLVGDAFWITHPLKAEDHGQCCAIFFDVIPILHGKPLYQMHWELCQWNGSGYVDRVLAPLCKELGIYLESIGHWACCDADGMYSFAGEAERVHQC